MSGPWQFEFMRDAALVGTLVAVCCALLSCFLVLRGWALMGDAIAHAVLPGIVAAYWLGLPLTAGAFASGMFCASAMGWLKATSRVKHDTIMGVVFTGLFALGLVMVSRTVSDLHLDHILYGNLLGITSEQMLETWLFTVPVAAVVWLKRRDLLLLGFDEAHARAVGLRPGLWHQVLLVLISLAIVVAMKAMGLLLVIALFIFPGATAHLLVRRLDAMLLVAVASAVTAMLAGLWVSFSVDASPGACVVLMQAGLFLLAAVLGPRRVS
jgi:ABC-type Mn2+/Zn2+ transport system permease subunit